MNGQVRYALGFMLVTVWVAASNSGQLFADPPSVFQFLRKPQVEADPTKEYRLTEEQGPWLILAMTFEDEDAAEKAHQLVVELRKKYNLKAYVLPKFFDFSETVPGAGIDATGNQVRMRHRDDRKFHAFGVLVGDFTSIDSPELDQAKEILKYAQPQTLGGDGDPRPSSFDTASRWIQGLRWSQRHQQGSDQRKRGPMRPFVTRNPLLPVDFFQPPKVDEFVKKLNKGVENSLLECPNRFTVKVATFRGQDGYLVGKNSEKMLTESVSDGLDQAAESANLLASVLRKNGVEAYVYHDRNSSIVTVGGFDSIGGNDEAGNFQYLPAIQKILVTFGAQNVQNTQYGAVPMAKSLLDLVPANQFPELTRGTDRERMRALKKYTIPFDPQPAVMAVPKTEAKSVYSGSLLGTR